MDTYHKDLATATEVLNKAYQLKQVDKVILTAEM